MDNVTIRDVLAIAERTSQEAIEREHATTYGRISHITADVGSLRDVFNDIRILLTTLSDNLAASGDLASSDEIDRFLKSLDRHNTYDGLPF